VAAPLLSNLTTMVSGVVAARFLGRQACSVSLTLLLGLAVSGSHAHAEGAAKTRPISAKPVALRSFVYPVLGPRLSSDFGMRRHPVKKTKRHHHGIDLAAPIGAQVRAVAAGTVIFADPYGSYGNLVVLRHANEITSHYGHCDSVAVSVGDRVRAGQVIARVGNTGGSTGPHLHLEIRRNGAPQDPEAVLPGISAQ
jgi:murein DD-endopeptidase MepM/ murein hydrolase activator NlpD